MVQKWGLRREWAIGGREKRWEAWDIVEWEAEVEVVQANSAIGDGVASCGRQVSP